MYRLQVDAHARECASDSQNFKFLNIEASDNPGILSLGDQNGLCTQGRISVWVSPGVGCVQLDKRDSDARWWAVVAGVALGDHRRSGTVVIGGCPGTHCCRALPSPPRRGNAEGTPGPTPRQRRSACRDSVFGDAGGVGSPHLLISGEGSSIAEKFFEFRFLYVKLFDFVGEFLDLAFKIG